MNEEEKKQKLLEKLGCESFEELEELTWVEVFGTTNIQTLEDLELLTALPKLEALQLHQFPDSMTIEELVGALGELKNLEMLSLDMCEIPLAEMQELLGLKNIKNLTFMNVNYNYSLHETLRGQTHLKGLSFLCKNSSIPENFLDVLSTLPQLENLCIISSSAELHLLDFAKEYLPNIKNLSWPVSYFSGEDIETMISMKLESLQLESTRLDPEYSDLHFLNRFKTLKSLVLREMPVSEINWDLPNLTNLYISYAPKAHLVDFSGMPHLKKVALNSIGNDNESNVEIRGLDTLEELEELEIRDVLTACPVFQALEKYAAVKSLKLKGVSVLKPEDIPSLSCLKDLRSLSLEIDEELTANDVESLPVWPKLRQLEFFDTRKPGIVGAFVNKTLSLEALYLYGKASNEDIQALASKKGMRNLSIHDCSALSEESINTIFSLKRLETVWLYNASVERIEVRDFPFLKHLLLIDWKNLMEAELANLPTAILLPLSCPSLETLKIENMPSLRWLRLNDCPLLYVLWLQNVPNLRTLNVQGSQSLELTSLIKLPGLESLSMTLEQLQKDFVLETLQELPRLEHLFITGIPKTEDWESGDRYGEESDSSEAWKNPYLHELERIQNALPNCSVRFF